MSDPMPASEQEGPEHYDWFDEEHSAAIVADYNSKGPGARIAVHRNGTGVMIKIIPGPGVVVPLDGGGGTNNSFRCPPVCP
jgi:hypothetical protein